MHTHITVIMDFDVSEALAPSSFERAVSTAMLLLGVFVGASSLGLWLHAERTVPNLKTRLPCSEEYGKQKHTHSQPGEAKALREHHPVSRPEPPVRVFTYIWGGRKGSM